MPVARQDDERHADDHAEERCGEKRQHGERRAQERSDHRQHLDVTHAQPFDPAQPVIGFAHDERHEPAKDHAEQRADEIGRRDQAECHARNDGREGNGVGQQALADIGDGEHDERAQENEACGEERRRAEGAPRDHECDCRADFHERIE